MKERRLIFFLFLYGVWIGGILANTLPVVSNVRASQRTDGSKIVDIYYDVSDADNDTLMVSVFLSNDNGATFSISPLSANLNGNIGEGIVSGSNWHFTWNAGAEGTIFDSSQSRMKVVAVEMADLTLGLMAYYPFNGNADDISGNNYHATNNGASLIADRFGNPNSAYDLDGVNDWFDFPEALASPGADYAVAFWIKNESADGALFNRWFQSPGWEDRWMLIIYNDNIHFSLGELYEYYIQNGNANPSFCITPLSRNAFSLVVFQKFGHNLKMTVNGVTNQAVFNDYELSHYNNSTWNFTFGHFDFPGYPGATWTLFNGVLDDIRFYNRPLTDTDINALYHLGGWNGN